jgi:hypothetical protein
MNTLIVTRLTTPFKASCERPYQIAASEDHILLRLEAHVQLHEKKHLGHQLNMYNMMSEGCTPTKSTLSALVPCFNQVLRHRKTVAGENYP